MSTPYQVITQELAPAQERLQLVGPATAINSVTVVSLAPGADVALRLGQSGDAIPVQEGDTIDDLCPPENEGLYLDIGTAAPGTNIVLAVFTGSGRLTSG